MLAFTQPRPRAHATIPHPSRNDNSCSLPHGQIWRMWAAKPHIRGPFELSCRWSRCLESLVRRKEAVHERRIACAVRGRPSRSVSSVAVRSRGHWLSHYHSLRASAAVGEHNGCLVLERSRNLAAPPHWQSRVVVSARIAWPPPPQGEGCSICDTDLKSFESSRGIESQRMQVRGVLPVPSNPPVVRDDGRAGCAALPSLTEAWQSSGDPMWGFAWESPAGICRSGKGVGS